jgi:hypothetical protein
MDIWVPVAHDYNPSYSGGGDQDDCDSKPRYIAREALTWKILNKNRAGEVAQGEGPEFKPQ